MMNKSLVSCIISFLFIAIASAQFEKDSLVMQLNLRFKNQPFELNKSYISPKDTLQISVLKFYLSGIEFHYFDGTILKEKNSFHLIDAADLESLKLKFPQSKEKNISKIRFNIGIDSTQSTTGALSGDLDPTKGMYWAWQSGYINMKIEGKSNRCTTRKNQFHFHLGGYLQPFYALRTVEIPIKNEDNTLQLVMDLALFFETLDLKEVNTIMSPSKTAMDLADKTTLLFRIE